MNYASSYRNLWEATSFVKPCLGPGSKQTIMKTILFQIFRTIIALVLFAKVLVILLDLGKPVEDVLNTIMFSLIGLAYVVFGFIWKDSVRKILIVFCGAWLIAMNYFEKSNLVHVAGICAILLPLLIARFDKEGTTQQERA